MLLACPNNKRAHKLPLSPRPRSEACKEGDEPAGDADTELASEQVAAEPEEDSEDDEAERMVSWSMLTDCNGDLQQYRQAASVAVAGFHLWNSHPCPSCVLPRPLLVPTLHWQACDWEAHPAECILSQTATNKYVVLRRGLGLTEYGLVSAGGPGMGCSRLFET